MRGLSELAGVDRNTSNSDTNGEETLESNSEEDEDTSGEEGQIFDGQNDPLYQKRTNLYKN